MVNLRKCGIIGVGFVGATSAFTLATSGLFSELVLLDANRKKAEGEAADINHGVSFAQPCKVYAGDYADLADCGIVVLAAGANQKPGETRIELLGRNLAILKSIIPQITAVNRECILLIVSNPVDVLTYMATKLANLPTGHVIGSGTVLDTARLKYQLGQYLGVDARNVHGIIIGEHGDSELAVWSSANISGLDIEDYCRCVGKDYSFATMQHIYENVRDAAYSIIEGKGATYYGIGMAVRRIAEAILRDEHSVLPVTSLVKTAYGEVCLGLPTVVGAQGALAVLDLPLSEDERARLDSSAEKLRAVLDEIGM
ncbi:MAG: L-lactate dehydrogenase [Clostridia bacterium]|nr:L-lactate dehydrogenase [Clostridia bacterium]